MSREWGAVEDALDGEGAELGHPGIDFLELAGAPCRQGQEPGTFLGGLVAHAVVQARDDLGDEAAVVGLAGEVTMAAQQKGLRQGDLEAALAGFDGAVLMRHPEVVAAGAHAVVQTEGGVAGGELLFLGEVVEGGRQAVGAVFFRDAADRPLGITPAGIGQGKLIEPVREGHAGDADVQLVGDGEVGEGEASRWVGLGEVGFALATADRPPRPHAPLQGTHDARLEAFRVPPLAFFEQDSQQKNLEWARPQPDWSDCCSECDATGVALTRKKKNRPLAGFLRPCKQITPLRVRIA